MYLLSLIRLGFEGLEWEAIPLGVKMCIFCVDGSHLGDEVSLLTRNIQISGYLIYTVLIVFRMSYLLLLE